MAQRYHSQRSSATSRSTNVNGNNFRGRSRGRGRSKPTGSLSSLRGRTPQLTGRRRPTGTSRSTDGGTLSSATTGHDERRVSQPAASHEDDELDDLAAVIMAVDLRERGTVGCAYYSAQMETLYVMEDAKYGNAELVGQCECPQNIISWASPHCSEAVH